MLTPLKTPNLASRWLIAPALFFAFCSTGDSPSLTRPSNSAASPITTGDGRVGANAVGDVKVGSGVLEIVRLRMDRQTSAGASILRQYAYPGGLYAMKAGETIELWAEWDPTGVPRNPRLIVNWGEGETDFTGCGACKLTHQYTRAEVYTVTVKLDDLSGTSVTRTFTLDAREAAPTPSPSPSSSPGPSPSPSPTPQVLFGYLCPVPGPFNYTPPLDPLSSDQARAACESCYGVCYLESADCAGLGWGPRPTGQYVSGEAYFGFQNGCSGGAGRVWAISSSFTTYGYWAPTP